MAHIESRKLLLVCSFILYCCLAWQSTTRVNCQLVLSSTVGGVEQTAGELPDPVRIVESVPGETSSTASVTAVSSTQLPAATSASSLTSTSSPTLAANSFGGSSTTVQFETTITTTSTPTGVAKQANVVISSTYTPDVTSATTTTSGAASLSAALTTASPPPTTLDGTTSLSSSTTADPLLFVNNDLASRAALRLPSALPASTLRSGHDVHARMLPEQAAPRSIESSTVNSTNEIAAIESIFNAAVNDKTAAILKEAAAVEAQQSTLTTMTTVQQTTAQTAASVVTTQTITSTQPPPPPSTLASTTHQSSAALILSSPSSSSPSAVPASSSASSKPWEAEMRLAHDVLPLHYDILLHPNLEEGYFTGKVSIHLRLTLPRDNIYLHKKDLNITYVELFQKKQQASAPNDVTTSTTPAPSFVDREAVPAMLTKISISETIDYEKNEFTIIKIAQTMQPGDYVLNMGFNGTLLGKNKGFYKSVYKNKYNDTRPLATSKFQPTYAREAFPCFDEPSFKSTFNVTLVHADTMTALSNMPEMGRELRPDGLTETRFAKSVPMVTYLACFIVSDFKYIQAFSKRGVPVRVYATPEQVENNNVAFALEVAQHTLDFFEEYFNISYPLPKLDLVAIPDFVSGAMEHWGLITFREVYLLYDPQEASSANKQRLASVISHEMAHQWFGNLVTTEWWDSLWLNEGFASYMEYYGLLGIEPEWNIMEYFVVGDQQYVMTTDARVSSHPIVVAGLTHPDDISSIFDSIPYSKGASILRMLENFMGAETFRLGIVRFLNKHIYSTASTDDLWQALNDQLAEQCRNSSAVTSPASSALLGNEYGPGTQCVDVKKVMDTWLMQMNFPVLHLRRMNDTHGVVQQRRFLLDPSKAAEPTKYDSPYDYTWYIPVAYLVTQTKQKGLMWMRQNETTILFPWPMLPSLPVVSSNATASNITSKSSDIKPSSPPQRPEPAVIKLNPGQYGFYKVNYDLDTWYTISDRLNEDIKFLPDARDRSGILDDAFDMARAGIVPYTVPLSMLRFLKQERSLIVWMTASRSLNYLGERLQSSPEGYWLFREFVRDTVRPTLAQLGWKDDGTHVERRLRPLLMGLACDQGDADCLSNVTQMFRQWVHKGVRVPPNFRSVVYNYGMRHAGGEPEWEFMLDQLQHTTSPQETRMLLYGLTQSSEPWQLNRFLYLAENETYVRRQDFLIVLEYMAANPVGLSCCLWDYFRTRWPNLVSRFTLNDRYLGRILPAFANYFNEELRLQEVRAFIERYPDAGAGKLQRQQAIETMEGNIAWLKRNEHTLIQWLRAHGDNDKL